MISQEIDKFVEMRDDVKKEDILYYPNNLSDKIKTKLSELLFSQLLPYVNNMNEFKLTLRSIVIITETFGQKYKFLSDEHRESIFGLISNNSSEIEEIRKECQNNKTLLKRIENNTKKNNNKNSASSNDLKDNENKKKVSDKIGDNNNYDKIKTTEVKVKENKKSIMDNIANKLKPNRNTKIQEENVSRSNTMTLTSMPIGPFGKTNDRSETIYIPESNNKTNNHKENNGNKIIGGIKNFLKSTKKDVKQEEKKDIKSEKNKDMKSELKKEGGEKGIKINNPDIKKVMFNNIQGVTLKKVNSINPNGKQQK